MTAVQRDNGATYLYSTFLDLDVRIDDRQKRETQTYPGGRYGQHCCRYRDRRSRSVELYPLETQPSDGSRQRLQRGGSAAMFAKIG